MKKFMHAVEIEKFFVVIIDGESKKKLLTNDIVSKIMQAMPTVSGHAA